MECKKLKSLRVKNVGGRKKGDVCFERGLRENGVVLAEVYIWDSDSMELNKDK